MREHIAAEIVRVRDVLDVNTTNPQSDLTRGLREGSLAALSDAADIAAGRPLGDPTGEVADHCGAGPARTDAGQDAA